jgi:hypothetical protein
MRSQSSEEKIGTTEVTGFGEIYVMRSSVFSILHVIVKPSRIKWVLHETFVSEMKISAKY